MILASKCIHSFAVYIFNAGDDLSSKYLDEDGPDNIELARSIHDFAMPILKIL